MPHADDPFISTPKSAPRKSPASRPVPLTVRRSSASLRAATLSVANEDDAEAANGRFSLAHELAVALMPEPSAGSKLLAEEFGIEYDEGAEGIDPQVQVHLTSDGSHTPGSFADELGSPSPFDTDASPEDGEGTPSEFDAASSTFPSPKRRRPTQPPPQDALEVLAQDLKSTDNFLGHLRKLDVDPAAGSSAPPSSLERLASAVICRMDDCVRDREGQVRVLIGYEREFRQIAGEVGGIDVLGCLDELEHMEDLSDAAPPTRTSTTEARNTLDTVIEEEPPLSPRQPGHDWETDPHRLHDDYEDEQEPVVSPSPTKVSFPLPPSMTGPPTPAKTIPQLAHIRSFTTSLVTSLSILSEQAQVNGAATTEAGRKIRALKNRMTDWRTEWDSAEQSRAKIDKWEAGLLDKCDQSANTAPATPHSVTSRRADGRAIVQEHLRAFENALADAARKTQAIMAAS